MDYNKRDAAAELLQSAGGYAKRARSSVGDSEEAMVRARRNENEKRRYVPLVTRTP